MSISQERLLTVIREPVITEKSALVAESANQYVFKVAVDSNKAEVKAAVEAAFNVTVESVRIANVKGKTKRTRHGLGRRKDWKKAYVNVASGQEIDFTNAG